ncbi:nitrous oxide reductase accessory protein NosL [Natronorubrum thiooxidans]|uniref:NosL protein n=1 Tax=Natronorubrum thiooxidans TaxID=308853 RepID=A0A1N7DBL5_9EURY|nr:nitrous oxide reductase accessory protein NosL [Natronorubrum thiooxidans]SIR73154.1 NosL protein [Natronorubrum thiooxidans]
MVKPTTPAYRRRTLLSSIGIGTAVGLAGCLGGDESEPEDTDDETADNGNGDDTDGDGDGDLELEEAASFPDDQECAVCSMTAADHPDWNAQAVHADGHREYFCSSGCLAAYYAAPEEFGGPDSEIEGVWVTDFETGELIDGTDASFVRVTDPDHVDDIMMRNPTPFADRADAEAFVDEFDAYDEDDIITLEEFDMELAELYRSQFFGDDDGHGHNHNLSAV